MQGYRCVKFSIIIKVFALFLYLRIYGEFTCPCGWTWCKTDDWINCRRSISPLCLVRHVWRIDHVIYKYKYTDAITATITNKQSIRITHSRNISSVTSAFVDYYILLLYTFTVAIHRSFTFSKHITSGNYIELWLSFN